MNLIELMNYLWKKLLKHYLEKIIKLKIKLMIYIKNG